MSAPQEKTPNYDVVPLRSETTAIGVVQSKLITIDPNNPGDQMTANLDHMLYMIDQAQNFGKKDLLVFHEFPLAGFNMTWSREECLKAAIEVPGKETEAIGAKARQHDCYIAFGAYAKLKDWPGHFMNMGIIVGPGGDVIFKHWKTRNMSGMGFSTTVYDVFDQYVEKYGKAAIWPVARTDIGNIAIMPCVMEPEIARAYAMNGAEILIRYMTGGGLEKYRIDLQAQCMANDIYGVFVNQAVSPENIYYEDPWSGLSSIIDNQGRILETACSHHETIVSTPIPMGTLRRTHSKPMLLKELFEPLMADWVSPYPPNSFAHEMPNSIPESMKHYRDIRRW